MGLFDSLLTDVSEQDREVFRKYPKVAEKVDKADEYVAKWEKWKTENWDSDLGMTKQAAQVIADKENEIEALRLLQGNDMTWDEMKGNVDALLNTRGVVTKDYIEKEVIGKAKFAKADDIEAAKTDFDKRLNQLAIGMDVAYSKSAHLPVKYLREFGNEAPEFTMEDLFKHMNEKKIQTFDQAYDSFVQPLRTKKAEADATARESQIREDERNKVKQEFTMQHGVQPTDNSGSSPEMSALTMKINSRRKTEQDGTPKLTPGDLGSGAATQDAYRQYMTDQAAGVKPKLPGYLNIN